MSFGKVIQEMSAALETLKRLNATAPVPQHEQAAMNWALSELQSRFPGACVSVKCERTIYSTGDIDQECGVYVGEHDLGWFRAKRFSEAIANLVERHRRETEPADAVLPQAVSEAVAEAVLGPSEDRPTVAGN
jgi:hypothetical protein